MNKKGVGAVLFIFLGIMLFLAFAIGGALLAATGNIFFDAVRPAINDLGVIEGNGLPGDNLTENFNYVVVPGNIIADSLGWVFGISYVLILFAMVGLSTTYKYTQEKWALALFFLLVVLGVIISIAMSNAYQDVYDSNDVVGAELRSYTLLSWLILYSPVITLVVMLFSGLIMLTGVRPEGLP